MSGQMAFIVGAHELPIRKAQGDSVAALHSRAAIGALADAGLSLSDVDGYFCAGDAPGLGPLSMVDYLNLNVRHVDSTDIGGSAPVLHVANAARAIAEGRCDVALITLAGRPRSARFDPARYQFEDQPDMLWEVPITHSLPDLYALAAARHMHEFGTTSEQLAWIKVASSHHASLNPHAMLREKVTVEDVLASPLLTGPLHKLDCCVISDGGGAVVMARPEIARSLSRPLISVRGAGVAVGAQKGGRLDLTETAAVFSGRDAFGAACVTAKDIRYASIYDSFTITVLLALEDLGFCAKGEGGRFVEDGKLIAGQGPLAVNTDGGGLSNNHPANRGGITKIIEAVRQLRGEAQPDVQIPDLSLALAHGTGGWLGARHGSATVILERM